MLFCLALERNGTSDSLQAFQPRRGFVCDVFGRAGRSSQFSSPWPRIFCALALLGVIRPIPLDLAFEVGQGRDKSGVSGEKLVNHWAKLFLLQYGCMESFVRLGVI